MNYTYWLAELEKKLKENTGSKIVGIFDSGVGGLTTLDLLNNSRNIIYIGDTAHFPYGEKKEEMIQFLVLCRITDLVEKGAEVIGIACNTASIAFEKLKPSDYLKTKIIGTIDCTSKYLSTTEAHNIGVIGTHYTVSTKAYSRNIKKYDPQDNVYVIESAEQELVISIEQGNSKNIDKEIARIGHFFKEKNIDTFILGCTHYSHVEKYFENHLDKKVKIVDPGTILANEIVTNTESVIKPTTEVLFTGNKPELSGLLKKYNALILDSTPNVLSSTQIGIFKALDN